jgi:catechol 2,3-dioxygenase-like lactoylglutathione lyase family enzyme
MRRDRNGLPPAGSIVGFDHIALPMRDAGAMTAFYRSLGLEVTENASVVQVLMGDQMINFHRPELWQGDFPLRAPAATPPCGDICVVWEGSVESLQGLLDHAGAAIIEGPVRRQGARQTSAVSFYVRDPDGNLVELMTYPDELEEKAHVG